MWVLRNVAIPSLVYSVSEVGAAFLSTRVSFPRKLAVTFDLRVFPHLLFVKLASLVLEQQW